MEKQVVETMVRLYCTRNHNRSQLCAECSTLLFYALERIDNCPEGDKKSFCSRCSIHCYKADMREQIRKVMRFSGPRMLLYHPIVALRHLIATFVCR